MDSIPGVTVMLISVSAGLTGIVPLRGRTDSQEPPDTTEAVKGTEDVPPSTEIAQPPFVQDSVEPL